MTRLGFTSPQYRRFYSRCVRASAVAHPAVGTRPLKFDGTTLAERASKAILAAVSGPTCEPYWDLATKDTLIINPPWFSEARTLGVEHAQCGVLGGNASLSKVEPIATSFNNGSGFLLWERVSSKNSVDNNNHEISNHVERICGVTFIESVDDQATIIATFRQPTAVERRTLFKEQSSIKIRPGKDNFFYGKPLRELNLSVAPSGCQNTMISAVKKFYNSFALGEAEAVLSEVASTKLHILEPMWEEEGEYLPVNRVEAGMWIERKIKNAGGSLVYTPKAMSHVPETNMVFALWVAEGSNSEQIAGIHIFFFNDKMQISHISAFREPFRHETTAHLLPTS